MAHKSLGCSSELCRARELAGAVQTCTMGQAGRAQNLRDSPNDRLRNLLGRVPSRTANSSCLSLRRSRPRPRRFGALLVGCGRECPQPPKQKEPDEKYHERKRKSQYPSVNDLESYPSRPERTNATANDIERKRWPYPSNEPRDTLICEDAKCAQAAGDECC